MLFAGSAKLSTDSNGSDGEGKALESFTGTMMRDLCILLALIENRFQVTGLRAGGSKWKMSWRLKGCLKSVVCKKSCRGKTSTVMIR